MIGKVHFGDCRDSLRSMVVAGVKVQTCVTSPPYFGLRDYGHDGQIGLEDTPEQYIAAMVEVFRCVRDVLADDGTLWVNIGDSYARAGGWSDNHGLSKDTNGVILPRGESGRAISNSTGGNRASQKLPSGYKQKDLLGIPWMLAFALRAGFSACTCCGAEKRSDLWPVHNGHKVCLDCALEWRHSSKIVQTEPGWYLRGEVIWHKPNPMPESATDRPTKAHEQIFLLSKSPSYFYDHEAVKENAVGGQHSGSSSFKREKSKRSVAHVGQSMGTHRPDREDIHYNGPKRNRRSVWTVATKPYKGAHFAVFPSALVEPCILAGSAPGGVVLDPFMGSGTTAAVAIHNGRKFIGCELNEDYKILQEERIAEAIQSVAQAKFF